MRTTRCRWCGKDVKVGPKGGALAHLTAGGQKCVGTGIQVQDNLRTPPKPIKGITQRNARRNQPRGNQ